MCLQAFFIAVDNALTAMFFLSPFYGTAIGVIIKYGKAL